MSLVEATDLGWRLGRSRVPRGVEVWVPFDRTAGVYGPQGSGKTLDLLTPALLTAPGAALVTLTKPEDLLPHSRSAGGGGAARPRARPVRPGARRAGPGLGSRRRLRRLDDGRTPRQGIHGRNRGGAVSRGTGDEAARFYAAEAAKVLQAYFHAAALAGCIARRRTQVDRRPAQRQRSPRRSCAPIRRAAPFWDGLLRGALHGDDRTAGNTITTVQQAMALFFQETIRRRCAPGTGRPATDLTQRDRWTAAPSTCSAGTTPTPPPRR